MNKENILIIHKGQFDNFPPLMSVKNAMNHMGYNVDVLTCNLLNRDLFNENESCFVVKNNKKIPFISNLFWFVKYVFKLYSLLNKNSYKYFWVEGGDTLALFGWLINKRNNMIFQLSELYDKVPHYKFLIGKYIRKFNKIVVPEINRAYIIKTRYNLPALPYVLPNKPNYDVKSSKIDENTNTVIDEINNFAANRKILLYQGLIAKDRQFDAIAEFVINHKERYCLVLLGKDVGYLSDINIDSEAIYYAGFLLPPSHLEVTKLAWLCILAYDTTSLNKVYCAPNKIWEYTKYSKPMLSQNLPGINMLFNEYKIGYCCDVMNVSEVEKTIKKIEKNYDEISSNTRKFYNSVVIDDLVEKILRD